MFGLGAIFLRFDSNNQTNVLQDNTMPSHATIFSSDADGEGIHRLRDFQVRENVELVLVVRSASSCHIEIAATWQHIYFPKRTSPYSTTSLRILHLLGFG